MLFSFLRSVVIQFYSAHNFRIQLIADRVREIVRFALPLFGSKSLFYWTQNIDNLIIGKYFGDFSLGIYSQALNMINLAARSITSVVSQVLLSTFSSIQNDLERVRKIFIKSLETISFVTLPLNAALFVLARPLILFFFGDAWTEMIVLVQILCVFGAIKSISTTNGNIFISQDKTRLQFKLNLITRPIVILSLIVGAFYGLIGIAIGRVIGIIIANIINFVVMCRIIELPISDLSRALAPATLTSLAMVAGVIVIDRLELISGIFPQLVVYTLLCGILYTGLSYLFNKKVMRQTYNLIFK